MAADAFTKEKELALWLQSRIELGKLEIVGGARMSRIEINTLNLTGPAVFDLNYTPDVAFTRANTALIPERAKQTEVLPRLVANYRFSDKLVFRAGYYLSVARPQISLLSSRPDVTLFLAPFFGPNASQPALIIQKGNPDLKPARTHSFDFSAEYYDDNVGVIKLGAFYKRIDNLLETNLSSGLGALTDSASVIPNDPRFQDVLNNPDNYFISVSLPVNNDDSAKIWGLETSIEKQFTFLPGALSGLGIFANYTFSDSSKTLPLTWNRSPIRDANGTVVGFEAVSLTIPDVRFNGQSRHSGTVGLTYNKYGIDANVAYTAQARRQTGFGSYNLSTFEESYATLDARIEYRFKLGGGDFSVYAEGTDLLHGPHDPSIRNSIGADDGTTGKYFNSARYFGGRQVRGGLRVTF